MLKRFNFFTFDLDDNQNGYVGTEFNADSLKGMTYDYMRYIIVEDILTQNLEVEEQTGDLSRRYLKPLNPQMTRNFNDRQIAYTLCSRNSNGGL